MKFSKKLICLSCVILPSISFGFDFIGSKKPFTGVFLLGRLGGAMLSGDYQYAGTTSGKLSVSGYGASFGGGAGYMMLTDSKAWFAGEVYYDMKTANPAANDATFGKVTVKSKSVMGGSVLIGGAANPRFVMYARAGYEIHTFNFGYTPPPGANNRPVTYKFNMPVAGAGGIFKLSDHFLLGGDLTHSLATKDMTPDSANPQDIFKPSETRIFGSIRVVF